MAFFSADYIDQVRIIHGVADAETMRRATAVLVSDWGKIAQDSDLSFAAWLDQKRAYVKAVVELAEQFGKMRGGMWVTDLRFSS